MIKIKIHIHYLFIVCLAIAEFDSQTGTAQSMDITTSGVPIPGPDEIPMPSDIKPPGTEESQPGNGNCFIKFKYYNKIV